MSSIAFLGREALLPRIAILIAASVPVSLFSAPSRLSNNISMPAHESGWQVEPRRGLLGLNIPMGTVPGPLPIPVTYRMNGTFSQIFTTTGQGGWNYQKEQAASGAIHFGYVSIARKSPQNWCYLDKYVLEDGTILNDGADFTPFREIFSTLTLPQDFGFAKISIDDVQCDVSGNVLVFQAAPAALGKWQKEVEGCRPVGYDWTLDTPDVTRGKYLVVMDRNKARIFTYLSNDCYVPLLWVDRFGHAVKFQWTKTKAGHAVEVRNHLGKGVQVQWNGACDVPSAKEDIQDLACVRFIGMHAPGVLIKGYPGTSSLWPEAVNKAKTPCLVEACWPAMRPTRLKMGSPDNIESPSWIASGMPLPEVPADTTRPAESREWAFEYDGHQAELKALTDYSGLRTEFTHESDILPTSLDNFVINIGRSVTASVSTDPITGKKLKQSWKWNRFSGGDPKVAMKSTFGELDKARSRELTFVGAFSNSLHHGNGAHHKEALIENEQEVSTTQYELDFEGGKDRGRSIAREVTVERKGEVALKQTYTLQEEGRQIKDMTLRVNGCVVALRKNEYDPRKEKLELTRLKSAKVTRIDDLGNMMKASSANGWDYHDNGLLKNEYRKGTLQYDSISEGSSYVYDAEGRLELTKPYGAPALWSKHLSYKSGAWTTDSARTDYLESSGATSSISDKTQFLDSCWRVTRFQDARGLVTESAFDIYGRPVWVKASGTGETTFAYSPDGRMTTVKRSVASTESGSAIVLTSIETRDAFGRVILAKHADGTFTEYEYDEYGRLSATTLIASNGQRQAPSRTTYGILDRVESVTSPGGASCRFDYAKEGACSVLTKTQIIKDPSGEHTIVNKEYRDGFGQLVKSIAPDGAVSEFKYDGQGNLLSRTLTPVGGVAQERAFEYDPLGRLKQKDEPETGKTTFEDFTPLGQPQTIREASGRTRKLIYDGLGRQRSVSSGSESLLQNYVGLDLMSASTVSNGVTINQSFEYSGPAKQLSKLTTTHPGLKAEIGYNYDELGALQSLRYPSGRMVAYGYDGAGRVNSVKLDGASIITGMTFNEWGKHDRMTFASGAFDSWTYKDQGTHLDAWTVGKQGSAFPDGVRRYTYDSAERLTSAGEWTLVHNNLGQLTQATFNPIQKGDSAFSTFHTFDGYRNQAFHVASGEVPTGLINYELNPMVDNKVPGLAKNSAATGWNYNANGEATSVGLSVSGPSLSLGWSDLGRLAFASGPGTSQNYTYGPDGLRVSLADSVDPNRNRKYVYGLGGMLISELGNAGCREVIYMGDYAVAEIDAKGVHELHCDHLGTPRLITNAQGNIEGRQLFGPYGESITMADNAYVPLTGYTGHMQTDATGLIYMKGRYYSPAWHRFVNSDHGVDPESINQFAYCAASPFMAIDPSGMAIYNNDSEKKGTEITHKDENGNVHHDHGNGKVTTTSKDGKTETHAGAIVEVTAKDPGKSWEPREPKGPRERPDRDYSFSGPSNGGNSVVKVVEAAVKFVKAANDAGLVKDFGMLLLNGCSTMYDPTGISGFLLGTIQLQDFSMENNPLGSVAGGGQLVCGAGRLAKGFGTVSGVRTINGVRVTFGSPFMRGLPVLGNALGAVSLACDTVTFGIKATSFIVNYSGK